MATTDSIIGKRVAWTEEDGKVATGYISASSMAYNANLGMDLTHVTVTWDDGLEPTQHTLESMRTDHRVKIED